MCRFQNLSASGGSPYQSRHDPVLSSSLNDEATSREATSKSYRLTGLSVRLEGSNINVEKIAFPPSEWVPNNQWLPVLVYKDASPHIGSSEDFGVIFAANGWTGIWRNGVFDYQHYHSGAHEALGVGKGSATLLIGGPDGQAIEVVAGDCLVLPAGAGHMNLSCSADFEAVGAYQPGQHADIQTSPPSKEQLSRISALPIPDMDPVSGSSGPLVTAWNPKRMALNSLLGNRNIR